MLDPGADPAAKGGRQQTPSRAIEVWLNNILERLITKFVVNAVKSYSDAERDFFKGPRGRFLLSLQLWIKMFICEKGILKMNSDE